jgi:hypothetical protein
MPAVKAGTVLGAMLVLLVSAGGSDRAYAQEVPRAFRGLFSAANPATPSTHRIDFVAAVFAGLARADVDATDSGEEVALLGSSYQGISPVLSYAYTGNRVSFESVTGTSFIHYSTIPGFRGSRYFERLYFGAKLGPQTTLSLRGGASYSPYYAFSVAADPEAEAGQLDLGDQEPFVAVRKNLRADAHVELTHRTSERSQIAAEYSVTRTTFFGDGFGQASHRGGVRFGRALSQNARLQLGYAFNYWNYPGASTDAFQGHDLRAGVSYNRALPGSPRTRFGFDFGSAMAQQPGTLRFDVTGTAFLAHQLARRILLAGSYHRGFDVRAGFVQPLFFFSDTAAVSGTIVIARRAVARVVGSYVRGTFSADTFRHRAQSWNGSGMVSYGLNRLMSTYVQATITSLRLAEQLGPLTGVPTLIDRNTVTGGLTLWLPWAR